MQIFYSRFFKADLNINLDFKKNCIHLHQTNDVIIQL